MSDTQHRDTAEATRQMPGHTHYRMRQAEEPFRRQRFVIGPRGQRIYTGEVPA